MNTLRCSGLRLPGSLVTSAAYRTNLVAAAGLALAADRPSRRWTHHDGTRLMGGDREVVGYGVNGSPIYFDCPTFPFPAIRYREVTPEICSLREKEQSDWKKLSLPEKKSLYRHSFCQTYAEFQYFTPDWKMVVGIGLWSIAIGIAMSLVFNAVVGGLPETYDDEHRQAQLRRIIHLQIQPITGLSSKWDYSQNKWK